VLVPNVVDGLRAVPDPVRQAATAMGFGTQRRLIQVELPLAIPIIIAGLRVAVVSSISLASVGSLIGVSSLGYFFIDGLQRSFSEEIWAALIGVIALALVSDLVLVSIRWLLTPWSRGRGRSGGSSGTTAATAATAMVAAEGGTAAEQPAEVTA
jgi:osmoprotectant transport system permease protein